MKMTEDKFNFFNSKEVFNITERTTGVSSSNIQYDIINLDYSFLDKEIFDNASKIVKREMTNCKGTETEIQIHNKTLSDCSSGDFSAKLGVMEKIKKIIEQDYKLVEPPASELYAKKIFEDNYGLGCIDDLLSDKSVNEVFVNGFDSVWVEIGGEKIKTNRQFKSDDDVIRVMGLMLKADNKSINYNNPRIEAKLKNGFRLTFSIAPIAKRPYMNIRKFDTFEITTENLLDVKTVDQEMVDFIQKIIKGRANILLIGETGSGKTSFLKWLVDAIDPSLRLATIETDFELRIDEKYGPTRNISSFETHPELGIRMGDLFKMCLRITPDIIIVGEARGSEEGEELIKAMRRGHPGSIGTFHTNSQYTAIDDFADMINEDGKLRDINELKYRIASGVNFIIQIKKFSKDRKRIVTCITEVIPKDNRTYELKDIYKFQVDELDPEMASKGHFAKVGTISDYMRQRLNFYGLSYEKMADM